MQGTQNVPCIVKMCVGFFSWYFVNICRFSTISCIAEVGEVWFKLVIVLLLHNGFRTTSSHPSILAVILRHHLLWLRQYEYWLGVTKKTVFCTVKPCLPDFVPFLPSIYASKCFSHCKDVCRDFSCISWVFLEFLQLVLRFYANDAVVVMFYPIFAFLGAEPKFNSIDSFSQSIQKDIDISVI